MDGRLVLKPHRCSSRRVQTGLLVLIAGVVFAGEVQAQTWTPTFELPEGKGDFPHGGGYPAKAPRTVRVQVFPHVAKYATPQGREKTVDSVSIESSRGCWAYRGPARLDPDFTLASDAKPLRNGRKLAFTYDGSAKPYWVRCGGPATVRRDSSVKSYSYSGGFHVSQGRAPDGRRIVRVVNLLAFEDYLKGVVPAEMPTSWHAEALAAQAIAARTYAVFEVSLARAAGGGEESWDFDDTVQYQAYLGDGWRKESSDLAVDRTRGWLIAQNGNVIVAYFSADSGGFTEDASNVWQVHAPYCQAKEEVYDPALALAPWSVSFTWGQVSERLAAAGLVPSGISVSDLAVMERFASGRAKRIEARAKKTAYSISSDAFARALGLRSWMFTPRAEATSLALDGAGYGHGAGMSQYGARALAQGKGWSAREILLFYYSGVELVVSEE